jgi:hypothetical protein
MSTAVLLYINDLPQFVNKKSTPILFANDTSILFIYSYTTECNSNNHTVLETINTWFKNIYLSLDFGKLTVFTLRLGIVQQLT